MTKCIIIPCYQEYENINIILFEINKYKIDNLLVVIVDDSEISYEHNIKNQNFQIVYLNRKKKRR